ncbi:hypothetical protein NDU88_000964 [Pleurodeles waltl]|uniref:Uncharacterized protein n=1 Tax=Pleurodeles waltl TaxID=8319 RepID=A0AAV7UUW4_PLEWA|nr:hypothetical protein NDU88_000964 [Pleurodeles waltl]
MKAKNDKMSLKRKARHRHLRTGDLVLVRDRHPCSKFNLPFESVPWRIVKIKGTMVTAAKGAETITRNIALLKHYLPASHPTHKELTISGETEQINDGESVSDNENPEIFYPKEGTGIAIDDHIHFLHDMPWGISMTEPEGPRSPSGTSQRSQGSQSQTSV